MKIISTLLGLTCVLPALGQSTLSEDDRWAWDANLGWTDFRSDRPVVGNGVRVNDTFLSGYAWSANTGWIYFGDNSPANGLRYGNADAADFGVNHDGAGNLSGLAWSANTGWISFGWSSDDHPNRPRFDVYSGAFSGFAWSPNVGWLNLGSGLLRTESMAITDSDGDGISDTWEREWAGTLPVLTGTGDADGDGISDREEYVLDTSPLEPNAPLRITRISKVPNQNTVALEWPGSPARVYDIEARTNLVTGRWLQLGRVSGASSAVTTAPVAQMTPDAFFRIGAKLPFTP